MEMVSVSAPRVCDPSSLFWQEFVAIGGPTYDDVAAFQWSRTDFAADTPHFGQPDLWKFKPVRHEWNFWRRL